MSMVMGATQKSRAIWNLMMSNGPEHAVPKTWLLKTSHRYNKQFAATKKYTVTQDGEYTQITLDDEVFLWPSGVSLDFLLGLLSELLVPAHPHHYLYGHTKISQDDIVMDIGACEGSFSAHVCSQCRRVIAIEPSHKMCQLMERLLQIRHEGGVEIINCLLGDHASTAHFVDNSANPGGSRISAEPMDGSYEVPVRTLDELVAGMDVKPTFIKCDAEGAALQIFMGGRTFLKEHHPKLAIASYHTDAEYPQLWQLLHSLGYKIEGKGFLYTDKKLRVLMLHAW